MNIRKLIKEQIEKVFNEQDSSESMFGDAVTNIETQLQKDLDNVGNIIKTQQVDIKNKDNEIKTDLQLKSKLDAQNPHKKGLEREIPEKQKDFEVRKKQLQNLEDAQKGLMSAQKEIGKQKIEMEKQAKLSATGGKQTPSSILPSLESPI